MTSEERALTRRARELEKQARKLQDQVERSGLGADLKPVPAPTVRDLSVPQARPGKPDGKAKPGDPAAEKAGVEGEVISAKELAAATTDQVLGKGKPAAQPAAAEPEKKQPAESVKITDNTTAKRRKSKPLSVAIAPAIGNYQLPSMDFLSLPDLTVKPTESKEELMANARLMQQTLAQFDIEVSLGDITKGPTITRYELHPAPGVKLERIVGLTNNITAVLKAERIHILAPVPGKSSVGVEVPMPSKPRLSCATCSKPRSGTKTKARIPLALGKDVYGHPDHRRSGRDAPLIDRRQHRLRQIRLHQRRHRLAALSLPPDQLRFVMIDPKVVELQIYNALPHLVVPSSPIPKRSFSPALGRHGNGETLPDLCQGRRAQHQVLQRTAARHPRPPPASQSCR